MAGNKTAYSVTDWYFADNTTSVTSHNLTSDVNFYAVSGVHEITNQEELAYINTNSTALSGKYILLNDIPLDDTKAGFDASYGWNPIGNTSAPFNGLFNGNGNTISNLWINRTAADNIGLFGYIDNAQIKNLTVEAAEIKGNYYVGIIAGYVTSSSSITNSYSMGNISGTDSVGGIAGLVYNNSNIIDSHSTANVNGNQHIGGIAGSVWGGNVINSYSAGKVSGTDSVGGIAGYVYYSSSVTGSHSTANVSGGSNVGGIAGIVYYSSSVANSRLTANVSGNGNYVGGIVGIVTASSSVTNNAAINPSVTGAGNVNRIAGDIQSGTVTNNFARSVLNSGLAIFQTAIRIPAQVKPTTISCLKLPMKQVLDGILTISGI